MPFIVSNHERILTKQIYKANASEQIGPSKASLPRPKLRYKRKKEEERRAR